MRTSKKIIAVNATAIAEVSGGMLNILHQFLDNKSEDKVYYVFSSIKLFEQSENIINVVVNTKGWINRLLWEYRGFRKWFESKNITPDYIISFQNTGIKYKNIPQYIYLQNAIPFVDNKWNIFDREERILWFYKNIFPIFIKASTDKNSKFIVQTEWMRKIAQKKLNISDKNLQIIRPDEKVKSINISNIIIDINTTNFFFPATGYKYKNHNLLIDVLLLLKEINNEVFNRIKIYLTIDCKSSNSSFCKKVRKHKLHNRFVFLGYISINEIYSYYKSCDCLLYPSLIESFGLPLSEAKQFNTAIIAIDLPYVYEASGEYYKLKTIKEKDLNCWANSIANLSSSTLEYTKPVKKEKEYSTWKEFHSNL